MTDLKPIGILAQNDKGEYVFIPIKNMHPIKNMGEVQNKGSKPGVKQAKGVGKAGGVINPLSPAEAKIAKEQAKDLSMEGRIKAHKEREKEE